MLVPNASVKVTVTVQSKEFTTRVPTGVLMMPCGVEAAKILPLLSINTVPADANGPVFATPPSN